ncbi:General stress protein 69 [Posidoniimonas polymericola]|uniref:General stress protein 69 n=1 Tax=Posidoniimonas polymericola TaxID=2528002 RepID=A0A5C5YRZ9_9BACT|nr:aldo/keto reductase [Posidoniimonas polymericola]TWT77689.1 General stress protein 69 [Posidoniimonas polymericola]
MPTPSDRRGFLKSTLASGALAAMSGEAIAAQQDSSDGVPTRPLGDSGARVSIVALGGHHIGQVAKKDGEAAAIRLMHQAIDQGVTFFDNCWDYHEGYSEEIMGKAIKDRRDKVFLMTKVCDRDYDGAKKMLDQSLRRLQTDYLDLWQFHEMVYDNDPDWVFEKDGIRAAREAKEAGRVKHIGFTGHKDPSIHLKMLGKPHDWDSAQMPNNLCDYFFRSFVHNVVPQCRQQGVGVIGMKGMGGGRGNLLQSGLATPQECLRYCLSQPVSSHVVGMMNERDLMEAVEVARGFTPLSQEELWELLAKVRDASADGRHELFKTSKNFDGPYHREQHGFAVEG